MDCRVTAATRVTPLSIPFVGFPPNTSTNVEAGAIILSIPFVGFPVEPVEPAARPDSDSKLSIPFVGFPCFVMALWSPLRIRNCVQ